MKIQQASMNMKSFRTYSEKAEKREMLRVRSGDGAMEEQGGKAVGPKDMVSLSRLAKNLAKGPPQLAHKTDKDAQAAPEVMSREAKRLERDQFLVKMLLEAVFGRKVNIKTISDFMNDARGQTSAGPTAQEQEAPAQETAPAWGVQYQYSESYREYEQTSFSAQGEITTADGRTIGFSLDLVMQREFYTETNFEFRAGNLVDPLVINFDSSAAKLDSSKFTFDLNADGATEDMAVLSGGSGYLVLDKNKDSVINNGHELFGPSTGDGFGELAAYDEDGNAWIDESDAVFNQLRIWTVDAQGAQTLSSLKDKGVGAISTSGLTTRFAMKDAANQLQGQVRQTGVFVKEDGQVGTVQQVDMAV